MRLIIDIPDEGYDWIKNGFPDSEDKEFLIKAIKNGIPYEKKPQGEWIRISETYFKCKDCNHLTEIKYLYCPICGNKMVNNELGCSDCQKGGAK